jgi:hypothetical protein
VPGLQLSFRGPLWEYDGPSSWHFVSLPPDAADAVADTGAGRGAGGSGGFGSVRVEATIGGSTWRTSLFPDTKRATYLLPVKRAVREAEQLSDGDAVAVRLAVLGPDGLDAGVGSGGPVH